MIYTLIDELNESANSRIPPFMEEDKKGRCQIFLSNGERIKMELKLIQIIHGTLFPTHPNLSITCTLFHFFNYTTLIVFALSYSSVNQDTRTLYVNVKLFCLFTLLIISFE